MSGAGEGERVWTVVEMIRWTTGWLQGKGFHNARLNAEMLLAGVLRLKRLDLYLQFDRPLRAEEVAEFKARLLRRAKREPLQYIEGIAHFRHLVLRVDARVLIPRPETEVLVDAVLAWARGREALSAADVGTGSGAIALALATEGPFARVVATDVEPGALDVARANHALAAPDAPIEFRLGESYGPLDGDRFDVVVSNPPYVGLDERDALDPEVRDWEPARALFAGADGLEVVRGLVSGACGVLRPGGLLALEVGAAQTEAVAEMVRAVPQFLEPAVLRDLSGRERIVTAELRA
ncbi:MAG: Release factor glutamine methyltransferase [Gemmatimonadetes bacterium]|nr:Release factor glutamine methyltransferase [Gemmatimonadota bacterium]